MFQLIIGIASTGLKTFWLGGKGSVQAPLFLTTPLSTVQKFWIFPQH